MKFASRSTLPASFSARCDVRRLRALPRPAVVVATARSKSFGQKRIEHAAEVAGACIMLAMFLMLALLA